MSGPRIIVVGARAARQGTGPFIARALSSLGASVCAIVGTRDSSVRQAQQALLSEYDIHCRAYVDLPTALESEKPDAVVICSPYKFHAGQLLQVARAGCHCLVEKPMAWPASRSEVDAILTAFSKSGLLLQVVNQWPHTLPFFAGLHGSLPPEVTDFSMRLSPISIGANMVPDSAPHFLGMLQALLGPGYCKDIEITLPHTAGDTPPSRLNLDCHYRHLKGEARARLLLETCELRPRPAWYQVNQLRADREVELPGYTQYLVSGGRRVMLPDPMDEVVKDFLHKLASHATTDEQTLQQGHANLLSIAAALHLPG